MSAVELGGEKIVETYEPFGRQAEFHECSKRYKLYGGA